MSETSTRARPSDTDLLLTAVDTMQQVQEEHGTILTNLESRPIPDLKGVERRLDELADALQAQPQKDVRPRRRRWWVTPALMTCAYLLGIASLYAVLVWQMPHVQGEMKQQPTATAKIPAAKRGK